LAIYSSTKVVSLLCVFAAVVSLSSSSVGSDRYRSEPSGDLLVPLQGDFFFGECGVEPWGRRASGSARSRRCSALNPRRRRRRNSRSILVKMAFPPFTTVFQICDKNIAFSFSLAFVFSL
jgi:hypothetical protein